MTTSKFQILKELRAEMVAVAREKIKAHAMPANPLLNLLKQWRGFLHVKIDNCLLSLMKKTGIRCGTGSHRA